MKKLNLIIGLSAAVLTAGTVGATYSTVSDRNKVTDKKPKRTEFAVQRVATPQHKVKRAEAKGSEYLMLAKSMFNDEGANIYPSGGQTISYPVYLDFDDAAGKVTISHLFRNFLEEEELPAVMDWDASAGRISVPTPPEFYSPDECVRLGEEDDMIISLQAGYPFGIGYWEALPEMIMNVSSDNNVIVPESGFAMIGNIYDDLFECYYNYAYYEAIFDARLYRRVEGVAIYADRESIDFGETFVNTSATRMFRVVNAGSEEADFVVSSTQPAFRPNVTSGFIAPGEYVDIEVTFSPETTGEINGNLIVDTEESSASITLSGISRESLDYSAIVSAGYEYMHFATGNEYPFVIDTELTGYPVAVSTNAGEGRTSSWLEVTIDVPEGHKGMLDWKGFFNPRWSVYDSFIVTDNGQTVYETPSDDQYVMEMGSVISMLPGNHIIRFSYDKGSMVTPIDVELGEDYAYISDLNLTMPEYLEHAAVLSSDVYDFGKIYLPEGEQGMVTRDNVLTLRNTGYGLLTITDIVSDDNFQGIVSATKVQPEQDAMISLGVYCSQYGPVNGKVTIMTDAGDFTIECTATVEPMPDYTKIVKQGDFTFEIGGYPFVVIDNRAVNDPELPNDGNERISEFTAHFNIPTGKVGLLTWTGNADCGDGDMGMIMVDADAYGMVRYEGTCDAGNYTLRPYQCWLEEGAHLISFGYLQSGSSQWTGENTFSIGDLSLEIFDEMPELIFWEETPVEFKPLYPGKSDIRDMRVYNFSEETMALLDVQVPEQFSVRFNTEVNSQVPPFVACGFTVLFTPTEIGEHSGNVIVTTSLGSIEIPVKGNCLDPSDIIYEEDFENGLAGWSIIDANNDDKTWTEGGEGFAYTGENCLMFNTFFTRIDSEDYLVSPEFTIPSEGATISYYRTYTTADCSHTYDVRVGTGDDPATFTVVYEDKGLSYNGTYDHIEIPLTGFEGQTVKMCFSNFTPSDDANVLIIDDVVVTKGTLTGLTGITACEITERTFFTIDGMRVDNPSDGIYIIRDVMKDGSVVVRKVLFR
ncbi:MAG: choice-of-anchor J domain-containing protein [Muribaculaceae bacterium]|nr:choice-of-anchor J domain-containing protein [Muribaculaceae bacterium]